MNKKQLRNNQDEEEFEFLMNQPRTLGYTVKSRTLNNYSVHITNDIKDPEHYTRVFDMLLNCDEADSVTFFIASYGGRLDGLSVLLEGVRLTDATVTAVLLGDCHSAASILALNCHSVIVTDSATMLCHEVVYGAGGKGSDIYSQVTHTKRTSEQLLTTTYQGFLESSDLDALLNGKQIYLTAEEIRERLEQRDEYLEAKYLEEEQEALELAKQEELQPKPKRKKKE